MNQSLDQRNAALEAKLKKSPIDQSVQALILGVRRQRRQIIFLTVSLVLDVLLTIGFGFLTVQTLSNTRASQSNTATLVDNCETGNEFRTAEAALWNHILSIEPVRPMDLTPEEKVARDKILSDFKKYLSTNFAPRDCNNIMEK